MATTRQQAQAEVYRMESEVRSAKDQLRLRQQQLATERDEARKAYRRGDVKTAESALANAERALGIAREQLRRAI